MRKIVDTTPDVSRFGRVHRHWSFKKLSPISVLKVKGINTDADKIDAFDVHKAYNLKGFEFGNWLNQNDRYDKLIACDASLGELAKILGNTNVGINGKIGIAFGARGMSKALAHYESSTKMINLTKQKGDGCLAHEYGHAIDHIIGMYYDQNKNSAYLSGGSSTQKVGTYTGGIFRALVNSIVDKYKASESIKRLPLLLGDYWQKRTECFARLFEQYVGYVLDKKGVQNEFLSSTYVKYCGSKVYMLDSEFKTLVPLFEKLTKALGEVLNGKSITIKVTAEDIAIAAKTKKTEKKETKEEKKEPAKKRVNTKVKKNESTNGKGGKQKYQG